MLAPLSDVDAISEVPFFWNQFLLAGPRQLCSLL